MTNFVSWGLQGGKTRAARAKKGPQGGASTGPCGQIQAEKTGQESSMRSLANSPSLTFSKRASRSDTFRLAFSSPRTS